MAAFEDIAVIGIGCRFPGATCLREFWDVLLQGENHVTDIPPDRWNADTFHDPTGDAVGKSYSKKGGFIKNYAHFDHKLFGINESEAGQMDPQQRQVLECTYMALENAGITRQQIAGQRVGVYIGAMNSDFTVRMTANYDKIDNYSVAGLAGSVIANRVSYVYNLSGPSMVIDTACSSSLVAIHQAALALRAGDCQMAICGGVNLMLHPTVFVPLSKARMLSPSGQCHAFSANADGYTRGEGCGIVILKPLAQAIKHRDNIWGTITTGINQDGRAAQPITAPSGKQQVALLNKIFAASRIDPSTVEYVEAHGTGTKLGDPVEMKAFGDFFAEHRPPRRRYIGSVKTNIGHLEPAAGVAGLIKVLLMMKHNTIVPSLHFDKPNELIDFDRYRLFVPTEAIPWTSAKKVACINSFGFGGTNSHAIVKQFCKETVCSSSLVSQIVCFSGGNNNSLKMSMEDFLSSDLSLYNLQAVSYTSTVRREHFASRKAFIGKSIDDLRNQVEEAVSKDISSTSKTRKINPIFVFCGMGTAWTGMCTILMDRFKLFRNTLVKIETHLKTYVSWSLVKRLREGHSIKDPNFGPIAIFTCQVALAELWESLGVKPAAIVGQSVGEVAAAHIAGTLPLGEAVKVIYHRTRILAKATGGQMLLIKNADIQQVQKLCSEIDNVEVALYYSPVACTISGESSAVDRLKSQLQTHTEKTKGLSMTQLQVTSAFHSRYMDPCQKELDAALKDLKTYSPATSMISTVDSNLTDKDLMSNRYWGMNVRKPVRFFDAIKKSVLPDALNVFIEIGPRPVLGSHLEDIFNADNTAVMTLPSLTAQGKVVSFLNSLSVLYEHKVDIKWSALFMTHAHLTSVPCYAFTHKHLTVLPTITEEEVFGAQCSSGDHLFVKQSSSKCRLNITPSAFATVYEHKVREIIVVPGATYAEAGFGIGKALKFGEMGQLLVSVKFFNPVTLKKDCPINLDVDVETTKRRLMFSIHHGDVIHAEGSITKTDVTANDHRLDIQMIQDRCPDRMDREGVYNSLQYSGFTYGSSFATIEYVLKGKSENLTKLKVGLRLQEEMKYTIIHPAILDGMLQSAAASDVQDREFLPVELKNVAAYHPMESDMFVLTRMLDCTDSHTSFSLTLLSTNGTVLAEVKRFTTKYIGAEEFDEQSATFKTGLIELDTIHITESDSINDEGVVIFTDADLKDLKSSWIVHELGYMTVDGTRSRLDAVMNKVNLICFVFPLSITQKVTGIELQDDLVKRIMSLRLIILYLANKMTSVPLVIISELGKLETSIGKECAGHCLHEAMKGFIRCALREYKFLSIQLVDVEVDDEFVLHLPNILSVIGSQSLRTYPEIKFGKEKIHMHRIFAYPNSTPLYRKTQMDERTEAVLCSTSKGSVVDPSFYPKYSTTDTVKDDVDIVLKSATIHDPSLTGLTVTNNSLNADTDLHPIFSLETVGELKYTGCENQPEIITCFPTELCKKAKIPKSCTIAKSNIPGYISGYLTKMYVMWCLCSNVRKNKVAILHSVSTLGFARAVACFLLSLGAKSVTLTTPDELETESIGHCEYLISTLLMTKDMVANIVKYCEKLKTITCCQQISRQESLDFLLWSKASLTVHVVRTDVFTKQKMLKEVPKLLKWIRSHHKTVTDIVNHIYSSQRKYTRTTIPINISELLQNTEITFQPGGDIDCDYMNTPSTHLFQEQGSYLVVGGLTGLGWECVQFLASRGAGSIVTLSRSKPNTNRQVDMDLLSQKYKCQVTSVQADVTAFHEVEAALFQIQKFFPDKPLKGVFFGAAVLVDATLVEMTVDKLQRSLSPKVAGIWNLHILTYDLCLDFFVLHSSGAAVLGNAGQSNYGAGNGFMDGLAHCRRQTGKSGQSINWGPLDLGMLDNKGSVLRRLQSQGYLVIEKKDINRCLTHMLMLNEPQALMCRIDRQKMAEQLTKDKEKTLLACLKTYLEPALKIIRNKESNTIGTKQTFSCEVLKSCSRDDALNILQEYVKFLVCDKALLDETCFEMNVNMKDQGVDSMYAMEITGQILSETGVKMSAHEIQLQSACQIAKHLLENILKEVAAEIHDTKQKESIISKNTITSSIVKSICGFSDQSEFNMGFVIVSTIQLPDVVNVHTIVEIAKECMSRHAITRRTWTFSTNSVIKEQLPVEKALDFRIISGCDAAELKANTEEPIQLSVHSPLRFILLVKKLQLRIVFHKFVFDLKAVTTFVKEFESLANAKLKGMPMNDVPTNPDKDIAEEIQRVLAPHFQSMGQFWKMKVSYMPYNSFCVDPVLHQESENIFLTRKLDKEMYARILQFSKDQCLTPFEFLVGIFQFLLAVVSNRSSSVVTISVDLRAHVSVLANSLGRCTNFIPLICQLPGNSAAAEEFLQKNKRDIERFTKNGLFPSEEIKKYIPDDSVKNFETNYFMYEDDVMTNELNKLKVNMPVIFSPHSETFFYVWQRRATQTFEIKFHLRKDMFTRSRAEVIVDAFVGLVTDVIKNSDVSLGQLMRQNYMLMKEKVEPRKHTSSSACSIL